jgi:hypothetical protein
MMSETWGTEVFLQRLSKIALDRQYLVEHRAGALRSLAGSEVRLPWEAGEALRDEDGRWLAIIVPTLLQCLEDPHPVIRQNAALALGQYKPTHTDVLRSLERVLQDTDAAVRKAAADAIAHVKRHQAVRVRL